MSFLLDTNVISEVVKRRSDDRVLDWVSKQTPTDLHLSSHTIGELVRGAMKLKGTQRGDQLIRWIEGELVNQFADRILVYDVAAAQRWGAMMISTGMCSLQLTHR